MEVTCVCESKLIVTYPTQAGHNETEEYSCPICGHVSTVRASLSPSVRVEKPGLSQELSEIEEISGFLKKICSGLAISDMQSNDTYIIRNRAMGRNWSFSEEFLADGRFSTDILFQVTRWLLAGGQMPKEGLNRNF
jgi:hypothetical protein